MKTHKNLFIDDEIFSLTLMATVGRAKVYKPDISESARRPFQKSLRLQLEDISRGYLTRVSEDEHINNIVKLACYLTEHHSNLLQGEEFRIGAAQKALNLYLKYLWCLGRIPEPPHCPFDFQIIKRLPNYKGSSWTSMTRREDYADVVNAAKLKADGVSLAVWELETYNNSLGFRANLKQKVKKSRLGKSAKTFIRELLSVKDAAYTVTQLAERTGKTEVNIRTALSDLRSPKYCGKDGVFKTAGNHRDGEYYYSKV